MGGLPILNAKNRQKVQNYRMRSERDELKRTQQERGSSPQPSTSTQPDGNPRFEVEVIRECEGALVCDGFYKDRSYIGVMLTGDGPDGTPGPLVEAVNRFRLSVSLYQNSPKTDQWISSLADRASTNGIQLRKRNFMKTYGRMLCASCMMPVPENEMIPRRHFVDANKRKLLKKPREQPKQHIVAQLNNAPSRHSPHAHTPRKQMEKGAVDVADVDNRSSGGNDTGAEVSRGGSPSSNGDGAEAASIEICTGQNIGETVVAPIRTNKRKAYRPREACNIVMPAGVDPFEPEYDFSADFATFPSFGLERPVGFLTSEEPLLCMYEDKRPSDVRIPLGSIRRRMDRLADSFFGRESERRQPHKLAESEKKMNKRANTTLDTVNCNESAPGAINGKELSSTLKDGKELSKTEMAASKVEVRESQKEAAVMKKEPEVLKKEVAVSKEVGISKRSAAILKGETRMPKESGGNLAATTNRSRRASVEKLRHHHAGTPGLNRPGSHSGMVRFKSEKIRDAFAPLYRILKSDSDELHMKLVRQPNEEEYSVSTNIKKNQSKTAKLPSKLSKEREASPQQMSSESDQGPSVKHDESTSNHKWTLAPESPKQDSKVLHLCISGEVEKADEHPIKKIYQAVSKRLVKDVENAMTYPEGSLSSAADVPPEHRIISITGTSYEPEQSLTTIPPKQSIRESTCLGDFSRPVEGMGAADSDLVAHGIAKATVSLPQQMEASKIEGLAVVTATPQQLRCELHNQKETNADTSPAYIASNQTAQRVDAPIKNTKSAVTNICLPASGSSAVARKHPIKTPDASVDRPYSASQHSCGVETLSSAEAVSVTGSTKSSSTSARPPIRIILKPVKNVVQSSPSVESLPCDSVSFLTLHNGADVKPLTSIRVSPSSSTSHDVKPTALCGKTIVKIEDEEPIKQIKMAKNVKGHSDRSKIKKEIMEASEEIEASKDNVYGLKCGDVVWAKNGTDAFWPGRVHSFCCKEGRGGAAILWFGAATYSPFIDFSRLEPFVDCYANRFNPKRAESNYHRAVAYGIATCLPRKGYFEQKLSVQVHKILVSTHGFDPGEEVKIITKRKRKSTGMSSSHKKRKITIKKEEGMSNLSRKNEEVAAVAGEVQRVKTEPPDDAAASHEPDGEPSLSDDEERLIIVCDEE